MNSTRITTNKSDILYDADCIGQVDDAFFEPQAWADKGRLRDSAPGRGTTVFVQNGEALYALRHYCRGGLPARLSRDRYLWPGLERTRAWREWLLLAELHHRGLPVPYPIAARVVRRGLSYQADIVTGLIDARPLAEWLGEKRLPSRQLEAIGACIRRFHDEGVYHADLNARNILLSDVGEVYLIDFDRGALRNPSRAGWRQGNLERLKRSLEKFRRSERSFHFDDEDWKVLVRGYEGDSSQ
jgi:3-deoxy-D-manno-octulosonic acid kinase